MTKEKNEPGVCPCCGGDLLHDLPGRDTDNGRSYDWKCFRCGAKGTENYEVTFVNHTITKGE